MFDWAVLKTILVYLPLSIIGAWRWSFWLVRRISAEFYRPKLKPWPRNRRKPFISVVTPVYNEDPTVFQAAMKSWIKNGVDEIVAVIDRSNTHHIIDFERRYASRPDIKTKCRFLVTPKPGKRAALCDGIEAARGELIALVDSDTIWSDDVIKKALPYFLDPLIGGATVAQRIQNPDTIANVMFDILLYARYRDEVPFLLATGKVFNTLSGRTAIYRRDALFNSQYDNLHALRHEFFLGTRGVSGDDKRLTHLIVEQGWHTAFIKGPVVYTPGLNSLRKFLKQRLRWTRNSWRADLRAVSKGWVFRHPALALFMIDRFVQPLFMLIGPAVMVFALVSHHWLFAGILLSWWLVSRTVRVFGYFSSNPKRLIYLPAYVLYGYVNALIKIYALATLIEHSWATRWHASRMKRKTFFRRAFTLGSGALAVVLFSFLIFQIVNALRAQAAINVAVPKPVNPAAFRRQVAAVPAGQVEPRLPGEDHVNPADVKTYYVRPGDTITELANKLGMNQTDLKHINNIQHPDQLSVGQKIIYYGGTLQ